MILFAMEHAVPQNVTSFEFHLVGDMTLRQFGYLAAGMLVAYVAFATLLPANALVAMPIIGLSVLFGVAFAFFPISDRPLDHWVAAFSRAVYSPTRGLWKSPLTHNTKADPQDPTFRNRLQIYLASLGGEPGDQPENRPTATPTLSPPPSPNLAQLKQMTDYIHNLQNKLMRSEQEIRELKFAVAAPHFQPTPSAPIEPVKPTSQPQLPQVTIVPPKPSPQTSLVLTSQANIINGIITDSAGNYLEGVIVSIHDKNSVPVRASKTNKLGQFAGATPLPSGTYTVTLEKDYLKFDTLEIALNGGVLSPLTIRAKKETT